LDIISLERNEVEAFIRKNKNYHEDVLVALRDHLKNPHINLLRLDLNGVRCITTNKISHALELFKHWNCEWLYITDHRIKMLEYD